ncbi:AER382Wp [Eremothecium gossypii ATCC 10895]|uniref:AER382Wp n=1 Tax=Eremothecium gossypii (strain ATCC 10895 / CBS 109.51 / FGSC 9923 / NRRL Y-1056) TaxID=284811 RepID=Q755Y5_EREGS|nr:AER382Wp [Eremothecium gossypii ATCC 10895]AAS53062.1 AER382Wp [Eremothecium gossypii ATCC 10895]AEY97370.1 FAER382Wp [Eremothecium gossypii FDAG1]
MSSYPIFIGSELLGDARAALHAGMCARRLHKSPRTRKGKVSKTPPKVFCVKPPIDIVERDGTYLAHIANPGVANQDDIKVEYHEDRNTVIISGSLPVMAGQRQGDKCHIKELPSGNFCREIDFPEHEAIDASKISLDYEHGILSISIPKLPVRRAATVQKIKIRG